MRTIVHIGFHKTGSTSIQNMLATHRVRLRGLGIGFYRGIHIDENHAELAIAALREERMSSYKMRKGLKPSRKYTEQVRRSVAEFAGDEKLSTLIFSAEDLSLLRHPDEMQRLASLLPGKVEILAVTRQLDRYLQSHRDGLRRQGITPSTDPDAFNYLETDGWMANFEARLGGYRQAFDVVQVVDYDQAMTEDGSVIPAFLRAIGIADELQDVSETQLFLNTRFDVTPPKRNVFARALKALGLSRR